MFDVPGSAASGGIHTLQCWVVLDEADQAVYIGKRAIMAAAGKPLSMPAASFRVYSEHPTS